MYILLVEGVWTFHYLDWFPGSDILQYIQYTLSEFIVWKYAIYKMCFKDIETEILKILENLQTANMKHNFLKIFYYQL